MDIPETGAVFTLGKSYLSENHQSYFFIKNDPIVKIIAGGNQSAVICESGRLFVWGENQYGQLSAGSKEVIAKPSCVKEIKNLGYKVRNIAFGGAFSVILTENNKIFFNGKTIYTINETYGSKFRNLENTAHCVIRHNYEIIDFHKKCLDDQGNLDDLVDIVAGKTHFVVLTNGGKLYCYGFFDSLKVKHQKHHTEPRLISEHLVTRIAKCGSTFVVFVTDCNGIYILGKLNSIEYTRVTRLNTSDLRESVYSIYVSQKDEIFLISSSGDVYKSTNGADIQFERIILFNQNDNIRKFCAGSDFVCVLTDKNKFLTTFNEKVSAKKTISVRLPHELRKFHDLRILDIAAGLHHILLFAVSKASPSNSFEITSSDPNENIPIHSLPDSDTSVKSNENHKRLIELKHQNTNPDFKNIISSKPILAKETLDAIQSTTGTDTITLNESQIVAKRNFQLESETIVENVEEETLTETIELKAETVQNESNIVESQSTIENEDQHGNMDMLSKGVSNIGESFMNDIQAIKTAGGEKLNDLAKETEKTIKEVPKNVIDYVKTSVGLKDDNVDANLDGEKEDATKDLEKQLTESKLSNEMQNHPPIESNEPDEFDKVKLNNELNQAMPVDDSNVMAMDELKVESIDNEVKFINNGIDVSGTSNIIQAMNDEINEMSNDVKNKSDELTMKYDGIINDELSAAKGTISSKMFEIKNVGNDVMTETTAASANLMTKIIPLKPDLEEVDLEADGDTEQTTASIKSISTPAKNQLEMDESVTPMETVKEMEATTPKESEGRVKRFFNEIKNNCKTADTVIEMEESAMQQVQQIKSHSLNDIIGDNKTSKVCTIL